MNPALLKLELFCNGLKIDPSCALEQDARPILRTRGGLGSGLELILGKDVYVNAPVEELFVKNTPYSLFKRGSDYFIKKDGGVISKVKLPAKPKFYDYLTSTGKKMSRIAVMQGTYLGIYSSRVCEFWRMEPKENCKFCSVGLNLGRTEELEKSVGEVLETVKAAKKEEKITFVHFNTGFLHGQELEILSPYIERVKKETGLLVGVQCPPAPDFSKYDYLKKIGVDHLSFCLEIYNSDRFKEICPGKFNYIGQKKYLEAVKYCVKLFGKGRISGEMVAGLEPAEETIKAIEHFGNLGAVSTVCIFRPCLDTAFENVDPPRTGEMIPVFKRLYQVCLEKDIPFGMAPNIKVGLVILPEEAGSFLGKKGLKFILKEIKLSILKLIYRIYFKTKLLRYEITAIP